MLTPSECYGTQNLNDYRSRFSALMTTEMSDGSSLVDFVTNGRRKIIISNIGTWDDQTGESRIDVYSEIIETGNPNIETVVTCLKCNHRMPNTCHCQQRSLKSLYPCLSPLFYKPLLFPTLEIQYDKRNEYLRKWTFFTIALKYINLFPELKKKISIFIALSFINDFDWIYQCIFSRRRKIFFFFPVEEHFSYLYKQLE